MLKQIMTNPSDYQDSEGSENACNPRFQHFPDPEKPSKQIVSLHPYQLLFICMLSKYLKFLTCLKDFLYILGSVSVHLSRQRWFNMFAVKFG